MKHIQYRLKCKCNQISFGKYRKIFYRRKNIKRQLNLQKMCNLTHTWENPKQQDKNVFPNPEQ